MARTLLMMLLFVSLSADAATSTPVARITVDRTRGTADLHIVRASLSDVLQLASLRSGVFFEGEIPDRSLTISMNDVPLDQLVASIADRAGLRLVEQRGRYRIVDLREPLVSLDVVEGEMRAIVASLARQCGIRNVMIDPGMEYTGTFRFEDVPCATAFRVVFESMGVRGELDAGSVLVVRAQR